MRQHARGTPLLAADLIKNYLFQLAKQNAPAIIFIDDSDVIFEASNETGFYRYLLTMLDGLESEGDAIYRRALAHLVYISFAYAMVLAIQDPNTPLIRWLLAVGTRA